jgi:hypothetical protein
MKLLKFKKRYWLTTIGVIVLYFLCTAGPLFAWSPIKPGYETFSAKTYTVYYPAGTELPEYYKSLDTYLAETSEQFTLPLKQHIRLIRTDKSSLQKYLPWMKTDGLGGVALQTGDVLYISFEQIAEREFNEEEYLRHEVVHLMHHQNSNMVNAFNAGKVTYLSEGVPFYAGGPRFFSRDEFIKNVKKAKLEETTEGDAIYTADAFAALDEQSAERYKISHMLYGEFIGYLIATYGQEKFNAFNHEYLKTPSIHRQLFEEQYGKKLEVVLQEFEEKLLQ